MALSRDDAGVLWLFDADGRKIFTLPTGQLNSITTVDLNEDGLAELLTTEVEGRGTGVYREGFVLYSIGERRIARLWHGTSRAVIASQDRGMRASVGYVRTDLQSSMRQQPTLTHLLFESDHPAQVQELRVTGVESDGVLTIAVDSRPPRM